MTEHARLGPSDSARWIACPGSINFTKNYPNSSSDAADEGTLAHWVREECLEWALEPYHFIGRTMEINGKVWTVDSDMADHLMPGIDEIREFSGRMFVEERLDLGRWMPGQFGTLDCGIAGQHLIVISDLKYGMGVPVQPVRNTQQMIYALGFWDQFARHITDATDFLIIIDQPRNSAGGGAWPVTLDELLAFGDELRTKAEATNDPDAPLIPTKEGCLWCPAANVPGRPGGCPAHAQSMIAEIEMDFEDLDDPVIWEPPLVAGLTPDRLIRLSQHRKAIENFLEYAHAMAIQHLTTHGPTAGQKAVLGRAGNRKWVSDKAAEAFLRQKLPSADPFNKKLKSPSQGEKEVGKKYKIPDSLVERGEPKPIMVPVEDARPAILSVEQEFDDVDDL